MDVINGFQCRNCTDIDYAKKHIDPAHPKDGPYGVNAKDRPDAEHRTPSVVLDGVLAGLDGGGRATQPAYAVGASLNLTA